MDVLLAKWRAGQYDFDYQHFDFDMGEHNKLLENTASEVKEIRKRQAQAQEEMTKAENESLERWRKEKAENQVDESAIEKLLDDPDIISVEAPVDANVWKVEVAEGDGVGKGTTVCYLLFWNFGRILSRLF
jgi:biotin carboxyl carrier protein